MNKRTYILAFFIILLILVFGCISLSKAVENSIPKKGKVNDTEVFFRKENKSGSPSLGVFKKDEELEIIEKVGNWYKVKRNNQIGFIYAKYLTPIESSLKNDENVKKEKPQEETSKNEKTETKKFDMELKNNIVVSYLPIYFSNNLNELKTGEKLYKVTERNNWIKVKAQSGAEGWILKDKFDQSIKK